MPAMASLAKTFCRTSPSSFVVFQFGNCLANLSRWERQFSIREVIQKVGRNTAIAGAEFGFKVVLDSCRGKGRVTRKFVQKGTCGRWQWPTPSE